MTSPAITVNGLHKSFASQRVLINLDWQVQPGRIVGLLGRNGAGKSTLLETLLGLHQPEFGDIRLLGDAPAAFSAGTLARIGYVPQQTELFEWLTTQQLLDYFAGFYPRWNHERCNALLDRWQIAREQRISKLSVGTRQRLSIVRALAHEPDLLVLDEPVSSLDPLARRDFLRELIGDVLDRQTTVVLSTHILSDLERVAMDVAFLHQGRIQLQGALDQLQEEVRRVHAPAATLQQLGIRPLRGGAPDSDSVIARLSEQQLALLQTKPDALLTPVSLEDLFDEVTA
ncbi:ABC-2 type transport system ATP-binding protein [Andreprevotia lacus DSM 23236]|jgi:ABC-2 type transport system ATP-binding protein|uniref:ABC-2 type transport system ATP-binding protein n=1 Tax=Andreprevotia lacus DSM 23236 TaxID=1121001 RepID=A0A1W1XVA5_9NEIS|nr:ABC transporter ATP-binding protein [Andreprevotia lacus]SMC27836.1 ABC-2 type transport system ATP-binding protein [Andreprevotia lacus DSM 23236]